MTVLASISLIGFAALASASSIMLADDPAHVREAGRQQMVDAGYRLAMTLRR